MSWAVVVIDSRMTAATHKLEDYGPFATEEKARKLAERINEIAGPFRYARVAPDTRVAIDVGWPPDYG